MPIVINKNDNGYWTCDLYSKITTMNAGPAWPLIRWPKGLGMTQDEMKQMYIDFGAEEIPNFKKAYTQFDYMNDNENIFMGFKKREDAECCKEWLDSCLTMIKIERANKNGK